MRDSFQHRILMIMIASCWCRAILQISENPFGNAACQPGYIYFTDAIDQRQYFAYAHRFVCQMHNVHLHIPLSVAMLISRQNDPQRGNTSFSCCFFLLKLLFSKWMIINLTYNMTTANILPVLDECVDKMCIGFNINYQQPTWNKQINTHTRNIHNSNMQ